MIKLIWITIGATFLSGCLMTRAELKEQEQKQVLQEQLSALQQGHQQEKVRQQEYDEQIRSLITRLDQAEAKGQSAQALLMKLQESHNHSLEEQDRKNKAYQEELLKVGGEVDALKQQIEELKKQPAPVNPKSEKSAPTIQQADEAFESKDFKNAIVLYQKYREKNPKGQKLAHATYSIGVCFKELNMKTEAKAFFDEVVEKYPSSPEAKKAKSAAKQLK